MESTVTDFLIETVLRFQSLTDSKLFLLIESGGKKRQRRFCGAKDLVQRFVAEGLCHQSADSFVELDSNAKVLINNPTNESQFASKADHGNLPKRCKVGVTYDEGSRLASMSRFKEAAFSRESSLSPFDVKVETCEFNIIDNDYDDEDETGDFQILRQTETLYVGEDQHAASCGNNDQGETYCRSLDQPTKFNGNDCSETKLPSLDQNTASNDQKHLVFDKLATASETEDQSQARHFVHGSDHQPEVLGSNRAKKKLGDWKSELRERSSVAKKSSQRSSVTKKTFHRRSSVTKKNSLAASEDQKMTICVGRGNLNPILTFDDPIPPLSAFEFDRVVFMPSKNRRPLLVFRGHIYRTKSSPTSRSIRIAWYCINQEKSQCPARMYTSRKWPCRPEDVEHEHSVLDHLCSSTMQDVYKRRADAEMVLIAKKEIQHTVNDTLGKKIERRTNARKEGTETNLYSGGSRSEPKD